MRAVEKQCAPGLGNRKYSQQGTLNGIPVTFRFKPRLLPAREGALTINE